MRPLYSLQISFDMDDDDDDIFVAPSDATAAHPQPTNLPGTSRPSTCEGQLLPVMREVPSVQCGSLTAAHTAIGCHSSTAMPAPPPPPPPVSSLAIAPPPRPPPSYEEHCPVTQRHRWLAGHAVHEMNSTDSLPSNYSSFDSSTGSDFAELDATSGGSDAQR